MQVAAHHRDKYMHLGSLFIMVQWSLQYVIPAFQDHLIFKNKENGNSSIDAYIMWPPAICDHFNSNLGVITYCSLAALHQKVAAHGSDLTLQGPQYSGNSKQIIRQAGDGLLCYMQPNHHFHLLFTFQPTGNTCH